MPATFFADINWQFLIAERCVNPKQKLLQPQHNKCIHERRIMKDIAYASA